jgi:ribose transport system substrate-binding protein
MRRTALCSFGVLAATAISIGPPAYADAPTGLSVPIGDASRKDQEYVWISNASNLPLFVERVYPGLESARKALNVNVRIAGPTSVDLGAFITTVDAECTKNPAGVIVVGGWDDALASEVDKCIDKKVPTIVTDGDLPMSKRLTYLGTNWYNLGYQHGQYQCRYHKDAGLTAGEIGTISFLAASNFIQARQGLRDALAKECPDVKVVADEESGTNVEQVAANTAAIIQGHPNLTGMVGFDSEAGPGIVRAVTEAGKSGKIIITSNEAGRDFMNSIKDGTVKMINMEKYETMDFFGVLYLYTFHNDIIRNLGMDQWLQNPLPAIGDSGLIFITADNVDTILAATDPASPKTAPAGLDVPIGDASRKDQEYVWISNASNLPLFVERVYPGLESARKALNVNVRIAGPTSVDLGAFITTVDAECTKNPAGVIVVGGWDDALASEVDKCIDKKVPTVVTDGDLPMSKRLTYLGTNWYNLGYQHGQYQCRYHKDAGLTAGEIGTISFLAASNFIQARQGLRDALAKECPDVKVVADEESGTNVEQVAANTAAIIQGHPNLTGMVGFDSEAGPGIVRAVTEAGKSGKIIITSNEAGRDFLNSIKDGTVKMINMEKYETMDFFAVSYLYTFHNDIIRSLGMDHWLQNPLPAIGDSGLIFVTADNVDTILKATEGAQ